MTVLEIGPGMGYFSLWMARAVGPDGKVVCIDVQEKMIRSLMRRAARAGVNARIDARVCDENSLGINDLSGQVDFCLLFAVVHEITDVPSLFKQVRNSLRPGASCLVVEPKGHVSDGDFEKTIASAAEAGLVLVERPSVSRSRAVLLRRG